MNCPFCNYPESTVKDSRDGGRRIITRRRECKACGKRWSTAEIISDDYNRMLEALSAQSHSNASTAMIISKKRYEDLRFAAGKIDAMLFDVVRQIEDLSKGENNG